MSDLIWELAYYQDTDDETFERDLASAYDDFFAAVWVWLKVDNPGWVDTSDQPDLEVEYVNPT